MDKLRGIDLTAVMQIPTTDAAAIPDGGAMQVGVGVDIPRGDLTLTAHRAVDVAALNALATDHVAVDRAVCDDVPVNFHLEVLRFVVAVAREGDLNGGTVGREGAINADKLPTTQLDHAKDTVIGDILRQGCG